MRRNYVYFKVSGKVQGVCFRNTFIRACHSRGLKGAASNLSDGTVSCYLSGSTEMIDDMVVNLLSGKEINSMGAIVDQIIPITDEEGIPFSKYQVTTMNVDSFNWRSDIEMYI